MIKLLEQEKTLIEPVAKEEKLAAEEVDNQLAITACEEAVNYLLQQSWDFISSVNSVIATLEMNYQEDVKKDIIELLNVIVDDITINIGMLNKITNIMNTKKTTLLNTGEDKAEKILNKTEADDSE